MLPAMRPIRYFYDHYMTLADRVFILLVLLCIAIGSVVFALNALYFHYPIALLFATHITLSNRYAAAVLTALCLLFLFYGMYIRKESPWASAFIWGIGLFFWCVVANLILANAIQATPFKPIDAHLLSLDRDLDFHTAALMTWTHDHPIIHHLFKISYSLITIELMLIPGLITLFGARKSLSVFYIAQLSTLIVGCLIYYFWPTMAPSGIVHNPYFTHAQQDTSHRFWQIHHYEMPTTTKGGLIAFPSFHVIWAILFINACRSQKLLFYPVAIINTIIILSTVFLGWHYLADLISGIMIAIAGILFANWIDEKSLAIRDPS